MKGPSRCHAATCREAAGVAGLPARPSRRLARLELLDDTKLPLKLYLEFLFLLHVLGNFLDAPDLLLED